MTIASSAGYKSAELQCYAHAYAIMAAAGKWQRRCLMMSTLTSCHCDPRIPRWPVLSNKRRRVGPDLTVPPRASIGTSPSCIFPPRSRNQNPSTMTTASWYQARKLIGLQKALEPGVKGGVYQAVILPGLAIPSPHISPRRTTFVHHLQFLVVPRGSPDSSNLAATPCYHPHGGIHRRQTSVKPLSPCRCQCAMQAKLSFVAVTAGLGSLPSLTVGL